MEPSEAVTQLGQGPGLLLIRVWEGGSNKYGRPAVLFSKGGDEGSLVLGPAKAQYTLKEEHR